MGFCAEVTSAGWATLHLLRMPAVTAGWKKLWIWSCG